MRVVYTISATFPPSWISSGISPPTFKTAYFDTGLLSFPQAVCISTFLTWLSLAGYNDVIMPFFHELLGKSPSQIKTISLTLTFSSVENHLVRFVNVGKYSLIHLFQKIFFKCWDTLYCFLEAINGSSDGVWVEFVVPRMSEWSTIYYIFCFYK